MPLNKEKAKSALSRLSSGDKGVFVACKLKGATSFAGAASPSPLASRDAALAYLFAQTGLTREEVENNQCCVLKFVRTGNTVVVEIDKSASAGPWTPSSALDAIKRAHTAVGSSAPSLLIDRGDGKGGLEQTMTKKDGEGEDLRTRMQRAAKNATTADPKLRAKAKAADLQPMDEMYLAELLDHQRHRYGRVLNPLLAIWKKHDLGRTMSFSAWLEAVEKREKVTGLDEALALDLPGSGGAKVVQPQGTYGGRVMYLDDRTRPAYLATVSKGAISGAKVGGSGEFIFVIGPDSKLYAGPKERKDAGQDGAFNHSSFFSGQPVKSAGTIIVKGGKIAELWDISGHYTPSDTMTAIAVKEFCGGDAACLKSMLVVTGGSNRHTAEQFLSPQNEHNRAQERQTDVWAKHSLGPVDRTKSEKTLALAEVGTWLVRTGSGGQLVVSVKRDKAVEHVEAADIGKLGLDRAKLLGPGQTMQQHEDPRIGALRKHAAYHQALSLDQSAKLLTTKPPGSWLLREGSDGFVALSWNDKGVAKHALVDSMQAYDQLTGFIGPNAKLAVAR